MTIHPTKPAMGSYAELMRLGNVRLGRPLRKQAAVDFFEAASEIAKTRSERASAYQMLAITERIRGHYGAAHAWFDAALIESSLYPELTARIQRDKAMAFMGQAINGFIDDKERQRYFVNADDLLKKSYRALREQGNDLEAAITRSFQGRLLYIEGYLGGARHEYEYAYGPIRSGGNDTYHLNHLMWWMRIAKPEDRKWMNERIRELIRATGHTRRWVQLPIANLVRMWHWLPWNR